MRNKLIGWCVGLLLFGIFGLGCGKHSGEAQSTNSGVSQQQNTFLADLQKIPPSNRAEYVKQHQKEMQTFEQSSDVGQKYRLAGLLNQK